LDGLERGLEGFIGFLTFDCNGDSCGGVEVKVELFGLFVTGILVVEGMAGFVGSEVDEFEEG